MTARVLHTRILRGAALIVPASGRAEWLAEWNAELWYVQHDATAFCLGSFRDALWLRFESFSVRRAFNLDSPARCVLLLVGLSVLALSLVPPPRSLWLHAWSAPDAKRFLATLLWMYLESLLVVVATVPLRFTEYTAKDRAPSVFIRLRGWVFVAIKLALLPPIMFLVTFALVPIFPAAPLLLLVGLIFGFRWALADQRRRCPICLHFLTNPIEIGSPAHMFVRPHGTELSCARGHGSLYVPSAVTSWAVQKWEFGKTA